MIDLKNTIDSFKQPQEVSKIDKSLFWKLFEHHSQGHYTINKQNKKVLFTIFRYFLLDPEFDSDKQVLSTPDLNKGLLIYGNYGIGKSYLFEILHEMGRKLLTKHGINQLWFNCISAGSFVEMYMQEVTKKEKNADTNFRLEDYYKGKLYIDDLGFEKKAFNKTELFGEILFERNRSKKKTYVTTNLNPSDITKRYGERIGDRLPEMFNIIKWEGDSFRK